MHSYESTLTKSIQNEYNNFADHKAVDSTLVENHATSTVMQKNEQEIHAAFTTIQQTE